LVPENSPQRVFDYLDEMGVPYQLLSLQRPVVRAGNVFEKAGVHLRWAADERRMIRELESRLDLKNSIVHIDLGFWQSFTTLVRLSLKTTVFVTIHTALPRVGAIRSLVWKAKGAVLSRMRNFNVLTSNKDARASLEPYFSPDKYREIEVAYSGFDEQEIESIAGRPREISDIRNQYAMPVDRVLIATAAQFIERKGCWVLLEALEKVKDQRPDFNFAWLATAGVDAATTARIEGYALGGNFRLMSGEQIGKSRDDVLGLINAADLFVLPSIEEGLPIALVEAMALGKPCIATRINGIPEAIENILNGILVEAGNPAELADAIINLINDPEKGRELGERAKATALEKFNARTGAEITVQAYGRAINSNR
jgi:glycosyltransferase involved in cell wall biosynthesis